jgi:peptide-methionine (S)-S-oxide reductase
VLRTRVGYTGGTRATPTYRSLGDHTESIQIDYDPDRITYARLLDVFWQSHSPTHPRSSRQYMSAIFHHDEEQRRLALESLERQQATSGRMYTEIVPAGTFFAAEDYHQKYYMRQSRQLVGPLSRAVPDPAEFAGSTAAARLNGLMGGNGSPGGVAAELRTLGLPRDVERDLVRELEKL